MSLGIFSTYRAGENRVTSSLLAVLRSLSIDRMQRIVGAMLGEASTELIKINNQVAQSERVKDEQGRVHRRQFDSVPDGELRANFRLLLETKTKGESVDSEQLTEHLERLDKSDEAHKLIVLTPDTTTPPKVVALTQPGQVGAGRIIWSSFADLNAVIDEVLDDPEEVIGEREAFLLRELQAMFEADGLLEQPEDVLVVAARRAWPIYQKHQVYVTWPESSHVQFRQTKYLAFYAEQAIQPIIPKIEKDYGEVTIGKASEAEDADQWLIDKCAELLRESPESYSPQNVNRIFKLTSQDDAETLTLPAPIPNDKVDKNGRRVAFVFGRGYVRSHRLKTANKTSQLRKDAADATE